MIDAAMGRISAGSHGPMPGSHAMSASRVFAVTCARLMPSTSGARAAGDNLLPWHSGHTCTDRKRLMRASFCSELALSRAFSTASRALR